MDLVATIEATPDGKSQLLGDAKVIVNGKFAQFGGRMMVQVSDVILAQFVENFRASAANVSTDPGLAAASLDEAVAIPAAPARQTELNGLAILWSLIKGWFKGLLGGGSNKP